MLLNLIPENTTPLYIQVYQQLKTKITNGELKSHQKLPSRRQMADINGISLNTVIHGYNQLIDEGYIYAVERSGYYVEEIDHQFIIKTSDAKQKSKKNHPPTNYRYDLVRSQADPEIFPFEDFRRIYNKLLKEKPDELLVACEPFGYYPLREALSLYLDQSRGIPCQADQIIIGPSSQYLFQLLLPLLEEVQAIGIEDPGYISLNPLFIDHGLKIISLPLDNKGVKVEKVVNSSTDLIYLTPNHQFPTGSILPIDRRIKLLNWAQEKDNRYIIEDDYDSEFKYSGIPVPSLKSLDSGGKVIYMGSLSRSLSTSIRISYMVLPDQLNNKLNKEFSYLSSANNTLSQVGLYHFIQDGDFERHMNTARKYYEDKRTKLIEAIQKIDPVAKIYGEAAGLHILLEPSFDFDPTKFKENAKNAKINVRLLNDYQLKKKRSGENIIYLSFSSVNKSQIDDLVSVIYKLMIE